jgi:hypothetical protein
MSEEINTSSEEVNSQSEAPQAEAVESPSSESESSTQEMVQEVHDESGLSQPIAGEQAEQLDELAEKVDEAIDEGASEEEIQNIVREYTLKINGKEKNVKLDLSDEDDIIRKLQLAEVSHQSMQEKAEKQKEMDSLIEALNNDPWEVLKLLGKDPDELATARIENKIRELELSPEERRQQELERELEELREKDRRREEEAKELKFQQEVEKYKMDFNKQIDDAISSHSKLPKSAYVRKRVADAMLYALNNDIEADPRTIVPVVEKEINQEFQQMMEGMDNPLLEKFIGNNNIERLRKSRLSEMRKAKTINNIADTGSKVTKKAEPEKKIKLTDFLR